ncbi:MAG: antibiotic biosynthesis monooxygenase [Candidatus Caldarchaeum sp.]|uniref:ABM domain-containing protein n=1 Tax=Caldiarchaeum subterraneum TaxID=311458 RepID=A0A7C5LC90_CALS0
MIIRVWTCTLKAGAEKAFERFALEDALPLLKRRDGCLNAFFGVDDSKPARAVVVTVWRDLEALKGFTGENWREPYIHPNEAGLLAEKPKVEHFTLLGGA